MLSAYSDNFTSPLPVLISFPTPPPFFGLIAVAGTSNTMLHKSGESDPCLFPDFSGKVFSFSPSSIILAVGSP